jgi:hypothetical protein
MKKILITCLLTLTAGIVALAPAPCRAQAIQIPAFPTNFVAAPFIQTAAQWATSYNTNYVWTNGISIDTGVATTTGQSISDRLNVNYDIGQFDLGAQGTFTGVGSAFDSAGIHGTWYALKKHDLKLGVTLDANYLIAQSAASGKTVFSIAPGVKASKVITGNTYATAGYYFPVNTSGHATGSGTIYIGTGFTF